MKLLTLNAHSVIDENYDKKIETFCCAILKHKPDIIALQEVMQPKNAEISSFFGEIRTLGEIPIKKDNFLLKVFNLLQKHGLNYYAAYAGFKKAYDYYDEGLAILSMKETTSSELIQLSRFDDYENYKTRFALGVKCDDSWFYSVHFNWENEETSPFLYEWSELQNTIKNKNKVFLMGDFNLTPKSNGYELVSKSYYDTYLLAKEIDNGITVKGEIDGWSGKKEDKRIDYIFTNKNTDIKSSYTIFNGKNEDVVSDHYGVLVEKE